MGEIVFMERGLAERPLAIPDERLRWMADGAGDKAARIPTEASPAR